MGQRSTYQFPFSRYPAVRIALFLIGGILLFYFYQPSFLLILIIFVILLLVFGITEIKNKAVISTFWPNFSTLVFLLLILVFGSLRMAQDMKNERSQTVKLIELLDWEEMELTGKVHSISQTATGKIRWDLLVEEAKIGQIESTEKFKARILADELNDQPTLGDEVRLSGMIIPISEKRNPHEFDYKAYLRSQDIMAQVKAEALYRIEPNESMLEWVWWREKALTLVEKNFETETASIAKALLIGYKQDLDSESKQAFARAGLSHIMAVSGLHVGFIVAPFWLIIPYFWTKKNGSFIGLLILISLLICYAGITGFSPSVTRASVMAGFLSYGKLFHRLNNSINLTAAAAIVLLIIDPEQLFDIGFQLSFSAVLIILFILPVVQDLLPYWVRIRWYGKPLMVVIVSIVVQFGLYPLQVFYFGEISLISPIANALFVPLLGIVVPLSLVALFVTTVMPIAGFVINYPSLLFLGWMHDFVSMAATLEWAWTTASIENSLIFLFWALLIFTISSWKIPALKWKLSNAVLMAVCMMLSVQVMQKIQPAKLTVTFFDVGQGDSALIKTPSGKHILIDAGAWSPTYNSGRSVILPHLKAKGIEKLDAVFLSHPHADHIGGIIDLIEGIEIDVIYNSGYKYDSNLYASYLSKAKEQNIPVKSLQAGDTLGLDPAILFLVMGPEGEIYNSDPNEHSLILNVIYGESEILFTGDAGIHQENRLVEDYGSLLDVDLLKVGHHGSKTSSGQLFLDRVTPEMAVISLAERNRFRHPHPEAVQRLGQTKSKLLFTSKEKALIVESDGMHLKRKRW